LAGYPTGFLLFEEYLREQLAHVEFTGRMTFMSSNQQCQGTEGRNTLKPKEMKDERSDKIMAQKHSAR